MRSRLLTAFGITEATDKLCEVANLPMLEWDKMIEEIGRDCVECADEAKQGSRYCIAC